MSSDEQCPSNPWTLISSSQVSFTCHLSSPVPKKCQKGTTLRWRSHLLGEKFLPWFSLASFGSHMVAQYLASLLTNMCASTGRISPTLQTPPFPTETECHFEMCRAVTLSLICRPGKFLVDHSNCPHNHHFHVIVETNVQSHAGRVRRADLQERSDQFHIIPGRN